MKVYKEKQFLIFDFEDGKTVKYDFATKTAIGKMGNPVKDLRSQLSGITVGQIIECCTDKQYAKFLKFIKDQHYNSFGYHIKNIGTILDKIPRYARYEQIFSAGFEDICGGDFTRTINDIPKGLVKLCKNHNIKLSDYLVDFYKQNPDAYVLAYNLEYMSLNDSDLNCILSHITSIKENYGEYYWQYKYIKYSTFNMLINQFGYTAKALLNYIDYLKTYEAIEDVNFCIKELYDYVNMMHRISPKFDKYPRHFLTTHKIACRNYNRLKEQFVEEDFQKQINKEMEYTFDKYTFIYPKCTQDIKDESVQMSNCVSSYVKRVIDGQCHILFLRYKDRPDESLVTIEVRNNKIVQALQKYNHPLNEEQQEVVNRWNKWWENKIKHKNKESENLKHVS